jgi:hypothetical protein
MSTRKRRHIFVHSGAEPTGPREARDPMTGSARSPESIAAVPGVLDLAANQLGSAIEFPPLNMIS